MVNGSFRLSERGRTGQSGPDVNLQESTSESHSRHGSHEQMFLMNVFKEP